MRRRVILSGLATSMVAMPIAALVGEDAANAKGEHPATPPSPDRKITMATIDVTHDAYGATYTAELQLTGSIPDEALFVHLEFRTKLNGNAGAFSQFTAGDAENLVTQMLGLFRNQYAASATPSPVSITEQLTSTATTTLA
jgi:hypothetical protein